jgi:hypothetical protein
MKLLVTLLAVSASIPASGQQASKMKMTTDIPQSLTTPDKVETRIGTLNFFDGFPDKATVEKVYDNLDFQCVTRPDRRLDNTSPVSNPTRTQRRGLQPEAV